jgi:hypothetical protein
MRQEDLLAELQRAPFQAFRIHMSDGTAYDVRHTELLMVGRSRAVIFLRSSDRSTHAFDHYEVLALLHITRLEPVQPSTAPSAP